MAKIIFIPLLSILSTMLYGQEVKNYNLDVNINVEQKRVDVKGSLLINFENRDSISLILWKNTTIKVINNGKNNVKFTFDTLSPSPLNFIPNGGILAVQNPDKGTKLQQIHFNYSCDMQRNMQGFGKSFTEDWIEIGYYTAWYPVHVESKHFTSIIKIWIDDSYKVSGSGIVTKKDDHWQMDHTWEIFDNVIISSKDLKTRKKNNGSIWIETVYTTFPEEDIDSVYKTLNDVLSFYESQFGSENGMSYLKFYINSSVGKGGYGRKNYVSMKASVFNLYIIRGIAHEIAHNWWINAENTTWEDWLNEAFAEYSMLMYIKERMGIEYYNELIAAYESRSINSPPIWGVDRDSGEAYTSLYEKGSLLLVELEQRLGKDHMTSFLRQLIDRSISNTDEFLKFLEEFSSQETRIWFENKLKV